MSTTKTPDKRRPGRPPTTGKTPDKLRTAKSLADLRGRGGDTVRGRFEADGIEALAKLKAARGLNTSDALEYAVKLAASKLR